MIYVSSDLHGCPLTEFEGLLNCAGFSDADYLFILGDVIDRGEYGADLLLWLTQQPNIQLILGNHEAMALACSFLFDEVTEDSLANLNVEKLALVENWIFNGGEPTIAGFRRLLRRDPELLTGILEYLREAPLYEDLTIGKKRFILVHAGLGNFHPDRPLSDYSPEELLMERPAPDDRYFPDAMVILGHTPTAYYGSRFRWRAMHTPTWCCIDTGAASGNKPMLLRLDDMAEFY